MSSDRCLRLCLRLCLEALIGRRSLRSSHGAVVVVVWKPTSLQVQAKVEERPVSQRTQQVVAALEGGH